MESTNNETSNNVEKDQIDGSETTNQEAIQENTKKQNAEANEITNDVSETSIKEKTNSEVKESEVSKDTMEIADSEENRVENVAKIIAEETAMEVDEHESIKVNETKQANPNKKDLEKAKEVTSSDTNENEKEKEINDKEEPQADKETSNQKEIESTASEKEKEKSEEESIKNNSSKDKDSKVTTQDDSTNKSLEEQSLEQQVECVDVDMDSDNSKEPVNEKNDELENTEFVQFNQDKDDSQLENQTEAQDPFGSDNLSIQIDSVESMEVDSASNDKTSKENENDSPKDAESSKEQEKDKESSSNKDVEKNNEEQENSENTNKVLDTKDKSEKDSSEEKQSLEEKSDDSEVETLPGQDDELCIIPDSTKENKNNENNKTDSVQNEAADKEKEIVVEDEVNKASESENDSEKDKETSVAESKDKNKNDAPLKVAAITTGNNDIQVKVADKASEGPTIVTSDIIDIDDEVKNSEIEEISSKEVCKQCKEEKNCTIKVKVGTKTYNVCSETCKTAFTADNNKATDIPSEGVSSKRDKRCANCLLIVESKDERNLSWETMEFCNEECLGKFQTRYGSYCRNCNGAVQPVSLGKYCVRFGYDVRQFCCSTCLEEFKKGLKVCSYCQKDISAGTEGFLAPVGDKGQFKDFCTQDCMEKYSKMNSTQPPVPETKVCGVCQEKKVVHCEVQIDRNTPVPICSEPCFAAFKFVNKVDPDQCSTCKKYFQLLTKKNCVVFYEDEAHTFCNKTCLNVFIITNRKIVPCNWCKVKKYNFDMIKKELKTGQVMMMCSLNCLTLYQVSINAVSARRINCDFCKEFSQAQYHLTMSDATIRNFCSYKCVMNFQAQYTKSPITIPTTDNSNSSSPTVAGGVATMDPVPTGIPKRAIPPTQAPRPIQPMPAPDHVSAAASGTGSVNVQLAGSKKTLPVISSVTSLAAITNGQPQSNVQLSSSNAQPTIGAPITLQGTAPIIYKQQVVTRPTSPVDIANKMTQCKPHMHTKGVSVRPIPFNQSTQTDGPDKVIIPIPVPIYVPFPVHMYSMPYPIPVPIPIPIPVPIFIPTTRNSAKGIMKDIKRIQEKIPSDPFEAELLMMAEMVATEKKNESDSDSVDETRDDGDVNAGTPGDSYSPEGVDTSNAFGDDMLQMALKMATGELDEPPVDLETALTSNTIQTPQRQSNEDRENENQPERSTRGRKRGSSYKNRSISSKRGRRSTSRNDVALLPPPDSQTGTHPRFTEPAEKPDANMALKYTFGVNAWRQWVITKNAELEKQSTPTRKLKLFKTDLLQLTADELNYSLCLFVKEVRKPSGAEYAPDTIYYLCLGIQQYLFENNRIDNIFTDAYYEKFTECLNDVAKKFTTLYNDALYVVTRVEEEHLWECKQLGAHSPHVLLNTLMYFNTKHFNLVTVEEHMQLSFSHIMKHWKRNPAAQPAAVAGKVPGSRNVLLRFYPPQSALEANSKKKKVYEQQENEDNPLRCPVKLYEFYLSKCPESVKTRNDVFYLLPERSCVPDSPVWYSTSPLAKENLMKMLHRIKMVKEINVALLSC